MKRWTIIGVLMLVSLVGCRQGEKPYGTEVPTSLPGNKKQVWAVAPAVNLSGESVVDPLLQSDLLFQQLQQVRGLTVVRSIEWSKSTCDSVLTGFRVCSRQPWFAGCFRLMG